MRRLAWQSLSSCLIAASAMPVTTATPNVVAVVTGYYRARYGPYHAHLRMVRTRHGWAINSLDRI